VRHASRNPDSPLHASRPGFAFKPEAMPADGEPQFVKSVNSGFIGTDLEAALRRSGSAKVVVFGLTTPHCVSTTARMAGNLGFETYVAADACAAFDSSADFRWLGAVAPVADPETIHRFALANLHGEFATVLDTDAILKETGHDVPHRISPLPRPHAA
jgi:isochorismate hydrolase